MCDNHLRCVTLAYPNYLGTMKQYEKYFLSSIYPLYHLGYIKKNKTFIKKH